MATNTRAPVIYAVVATAAALASLASPIWAITPEVQTKVVLAAAHVLAAAIYVPPVVRRMAANAARRGGR